jgi:hypothetical protein
VARAFFLALLLDGRRTDALARRGGQIVPPRRWVVGTVDLCSATCGSYRESVGQSGARSGKDARHVQAPLRTWAKTSAMRVKTSF